LLIISDLYPDLIIASERYKGKFESESSIDMKKF